MSHTFAVAPWPLSLKLISGLASLLMIGVAFAAYQAIPTPAGFTHDFGLLMALLPLFILLGSLPFMVTGYTVKDHHLSVQRPFFATEVSLTGLSKIWWEPNICRGSIRVMGNGGLFSFTGLFRRADLGVYRMFATDFSRAIVLVLPKRAVVVTPESPEQLIDYLHQLFPTAEIIKHENS